MEISESCAFGRGNNTLAKQQGVVGSALNASIEHGGKIVS